MYMYACAGEAGRQVRHEATGGGPKASARKDGQSYGGCGKTATGAGHGLSILRNLPSYTQSLARDLKQKVLIKMIRAGDIVCIAEA